MIVKLSISWVSEVRVLSSAQSPDYPILTGDFCLTGVILSIGEMSAMDFDLRLSSHLILVIANRLNREHQTRAAGSLTRSEIAA